MIDMLGMLKTGIIIGRLLRKISHLCPLFLRRCGNMECVVTVKRWYSTDIPQVGLSTSSGGISSIDTIETMSVRNDFLILVKSVNASLLFTIVAFL